MQKILALAGDFYHGADYLREGLEGILRDKYSLDIKDNYREIPWQELEEYDVFILACSGKLNPNDEIWITTEEEEFIDNYVSSGGKLLVLHCGLADFSTEGILRQVVKGHFLEHPEEHPEILVSPVKNDLFPVEEIEEFKIVDELYIVDVDLEDTTVFLQAESEEYGNAIAGWAHQYGQGKVYCLTPGHTLEVLKEEMMAKLIIKGVEW